MTAAKRPYPWFFTVNDRPVKFEQAPSGELDVLAWDFGTKQMVSDLSYLSAVFEPGKDVEELTEAAFNERVAALRGR